VPYEDCKLGSLGPGGGVVFYDDGKSNSWGRYLELAPLNWDLSIRYGSYQPRFVWCVPKSEDIKTNAKTIFYSTENAVGNGPRNTQILVENCSSGAGNRARSYQGGGKSDWYLPTSDELYHLDQFTKDEKWTWYDKVRTYLDDGKYWSSNCLHFGYGCGSIGATNFLFHERWTMSPLTLWERELGIVRPVRAF
jgi:hypothetical protein